MLHKTSHEGKQKEEKIHLREQEDTTVPHKHIPMSTEDQEELFKLKNTDRRTNENGLAMNEVKLENKSEDSRYQVLQFAPYQRKFYSFKKLLWVGCKRNYRVQPIQGIWTHAPQKLLRRHMEIFPVTIRLCTVLPLHEVLFLRSVRYGYIWISSWKWKRLRTFLLVYKNSCDEVQKQCTILEPFKSKRGKKGKKLQKMQRACRFFF